MRTPTLFLLASSLAAAGCSTGGAGPVDVTRFHLGAPIARGTVAVEPAMAGEGASLEFQTYADAVAAALQRNGYRVVADRGSSDLLATVQFTRSVRDVAAPRNNASIGVGVGAGSGGYRGGGGVGLGGSIGIPIGGRGNADVLVSEMSVQLKRRSDGSAIWEGRAQTQNRGDTVAANAIADRLAGALFQNYPGQSGTTVTVR